MIDTVESALNQTITDLEIIISIDGGAPVPSIDVYRDHPKIRIFDHSERLGWVANSNFALMQARGPYFMILPHDDLLQPRYLEACLDLLETDKRVFAASTGLRIGGESLVPPEVTGPRWKRVRKVLTSLYNGYSYRALMRRRESDWADLELIENPPTNMAVDTTWLLQQVCLGEFRCVPEILYQKRSVGLNTHHAWAKLSEEDLAHAWQVHCDTCVAISKKYFALRWIAHIWVNQRRTASAVEEAPEFLKAVTG